MPWGVEKLSEKDRQKTMVMAGVDQIGGDNNPRYIIELAKEGGVPAARIDASARRVLRAMFLLGVFENPYVDTARAKSVVASRAFLDAGYAAQVKSTVLLKNANNVLPVAASAKVYVQGIARDVASRYGTVVDDPKGADVAIIRVASPNTVFPYGGGFAGGGGARGGGAPAPVLSGLAFGTTLSYQGASNQSVLDDIKKLVASGTRTVVVVNMDRPVILTEFIDDAAGVFAAFGASDGALLDVVFGKASPTGKLPYNLPTDMPSVLAQAEDLAHDIADPLFKFGFGLTYAKR
jgi:beta-glucosidase